MWVIKWELDDRWGFSMWENSYQIIKFKTVVEAHNHIHRYRLYNHYDEVNVVIEED